MKVCILLDSSSGKGFMYSPGVLVCLQVFLHTCLEATRIDRGNDRIVYCSDWFPGVVLKIAKSHGLESTSAKDMPALHQTTGMEHPVMVDLTGKEPKQLSPPILGGPLGFSLFAAGPGALCAMLPGLHRGRGYLFQFPQDLSGIRVRGTFLY